MEKGEAFGHFNTIVGGEAKIHGQGVVFQCVFSLSAGVKRPARDIGIRPVGPDQAALSDICTVGILLQQDKGLS